MNSVNGNNRLFSMPIFGIYFCKYAFRVCTVITFIIVFVLNPDILTSGIENFKTLFFTLSMMLVFVCISDLIFRRFASKICFDLDKSEVTFFMIIPLIREKVIIVKIEEIEKVILKAPITFFVDGKKVRYNGSNNDELILFLKELDLPRMVHT